MPLPSQPRRDFAPLVAVAVCTAYAVVRYHVFKGVAWDQFPVYVLNKGVSLASLVMLAMSRCGDDGALRHGRGVAGLLLTGCHVVLSLVVLRPAYFPDWHDAGGMLRLHAEASMLAGCAALACLAWIRTQGSVAVPYLGRAVLGLTAVHVLLMGYAGWLTPTQWPGYLPPITLLSFAVAAAGFMWPCRRGERTE